MPIDLHEKLSPHFTLSELVHTSHRYIDNNPTPEIVEQLRTLCRDFLEPVRTIFGPLRINSGYRCPELNTAIGGSKTSAHMHGCAADFVPLHDYTTNQIVKWIADSGLPFDQVIDEYSSTSNWVHMGIVPPVRDPRRQVLTMRRGKYSLFDGS
ncbi:hypothetical protein LCGC14_0424710 [marine sediment metagenome]|uniref:Peptidase M15A C-terminal domain-containing protein n=1 Tax=marine sediment metagenome TaxID=412755 RepID=A0A0F9SVY8_9ZZZZ